MIPAEETTKADLDREAELEEERQRKIARYNEGKRRQSMSMMTTLALAMSQFIPDDGIFGNYSGKPFDSDYQTEKKKPMPLNEEEKEYLAGLAGKAKKNFIKEMKEKYKC